jgi:vacuolar-type H+-ATPase subunit I/STV1
MTDEQTTQQTERPRPTPGDAWHDVGQQFKALGESLATAFRTAWEDEENRRRAQSMKSGLEAMVNELGQAIQEASASPEAQKARSEAEKAAQTIRVAGQQSWQEARPHLVSALRQLNAELQKAIGQLEQEESAAKATPQDQPGKQDAE